MAFWGVEQCTVLLGALYILFGRASFDTIGGMTLIIWNLHTIGIRIESYASILFSSQSYMGIFIPYIPCLFLWW